MTHAIILAAGRASRMGVPKVLLPAGSHTLLSSVLSTALTAISGQVVAVLGRDTALCQADIKRYLEAYPQHRARVATAFNPDYAKGLSTSLQCGVREVLRLEPNTSTMVFLADQPAFTQTQARDLIQKFREKRTDTVAVAAAEHGKQRNPIVFSAELLSELLEIQGDKGAREVLERYKGRVERLELASGPWFVDTDDWNTYAKLMREQNWLEEVLIPEFAGNLSDELSENIETHLRREPRPLLAPDVLLVETKYIHFAGGVRLERPALQTLMEQGIKTVILGNATSPEAYLNLLRRAALWTLRRT